MLYSCTRGNSWRQRVKQMKSLASYILHIVFIALFWNPERNCCCLTKTYKSGNFSCTYHRNVNVSDLLHHDDNKLFVLMFSLHSLLLQPKITDVALRNSEVRLKFPRCSCQDVFFVSVNDILYSGRITRGPEGAWPPERPGGPLEAPGLRGYKGPLKAPPLKSRQIQCMICNISISF